MDLHFGTITATSPGLGHGCTFTVEYPVVRRIRTLTSGLSAQPADTIHGERGVRDQDQPLVVPHLLSTSKSKESFTCVAEHDIERPDLSSPVKLLCKVLIVDDSAPSRKMLSRSGNAVSFVI